MTDREKLIKLLKNAKYPLFKGYPAEVSLGVQHSDLAFEYIADYLLANGVIAPPVKVGTEVFFVAEWDNDVYRVIKGTLISYSLDAKSLWFNCRYDCGLNYWHPINDFGERVFSTKEEAEKALKERESKWYARNAVKRYTN